jgi:hypothetical protein
MKKVQVKIPRMKTRSSMNIDFWGPWRSRLMRAVRPARRKWAQMR